MKWFVIQLPTSWLDMMKRSLLLLIVSFSFISTSLGQRAWEKPGCHLL
ncbi:hypothetical protein LSH36_8g02003, partial [Paralvinella palmiformis]